MDDLNEIKEWFKLAIGKVKFFKFSLIIVITAFLLALIAKFKLNTDKVFLYAIGVLLISFFAFILNALTNLKDRFLRTLIYIVSGAIILFMAALVISFGIFIWTKQPEFFKRWFPDNSIPETDGLQQVSLINSCTQPAFNYQSSDTNYFNIVIGNYSSFNNQEIGEIIKNRFVSIKENLLPDLNLKYCANYKVPADSALAIQKANNCDLLLFGNFINRGSSFDTNMITYNFVLTNNFNVGIDNFAINENYLKINTIEEIRLGKGQEKYDYIVFFLAGLADFKKRKYDKALYFFSKANTCSKTSIVNYFISHCYIELKKYETAKQYIQLSLTSKPEVTAYKFTKQLATELNVIQNTPKDTINSEMNYYAYYKNGDFEIAKIQLQKAINKTPDIPTNYLNYNLCIRELSKKQPTIVSTDLNTYLANVINVVKILTKDSLNSREYKNYLYRNILSSNYFALNILTPGGLSIESKQLYANTIAALQFNNLNEAEQQFAQYTKATLKTGTVSSTIFDFSMALNVQMQYFRRFLK